MNKLESFSMKDVELEITNACNHRCPYCYIGDILTKSDLYFSDYNDICRVVDKLNEYGVEAIALLGGDPVLHPRFLDIIKYIKNNTNIKVSIMSNTLNFGEDDIETVAKYIDNIDFTLHGIGAEEHEKYCESKKGLYNDVMNKLKFFKDKGISVNIAINIIPNTYNKIFEMCKAVIDEGVKFNTLLLQRIIPIGRASNKTDYDINKKQIEVAFQQIERVEQTFGVDISFEDPFPLCVVDEKYHKYMKGCPEGVTRIPVRGDGMISSCGACGDRNLGNILYDSYEDIWENNSRYNQFRSGEFLTNERCTDCKYKEKCRGGCPVRYIMSETKDSSFWEKFESE